MGNSTLNLINGTLNVDSGVLTKFRRYDGYTCIRTDGTVTVLVPLISVQVQ
jgi:hypothetical protein